MLAALRRPAQAWWVPRDCRARSHNRERPCPIVSKWQDAATEQGRGCQRGGAGRQGELASWGWGPASHEATMALPGVLSGEIPVEGPKTLRRPRHGRRVSRRGWCRLQAPRPPRVAPEDREAQPDVPSPCLPQTQASGHTGKCQESMLWSAPSDLDPTRATLTGRLCAAGSMVGRLPRELWFPFPTWKAVRAACSAAREAE